MVESEVSDLFPGMGNELELNENAAGMSPEMRFGPADRSEDEDDGEDDGEEDEEDDPDEEVKLSESMPHTRESSSMFRVMISETSLVFTVKSLNNPAPEGS